MSKELVERLGKYVSDEDGDCGDFAKDIHAAIQIIEAALSQQDAVAEVGPARTIHWLPPFERMSVGTKLYTAPPSTAQGDPEEIRERVARIINTKGYEKLHCIVGQKGAEDIRFLVDCLRGV